MFDQRIKWPTSFDIFDMFFDITQHLKVVPGYIITSCLAGDYFQALCNIIVVQQQSSLIITPEWEYSS